MNTVAVFVKKPSRITKTPIPAVVQPSLRRCFVSAILLSKRPSSFASCLLLRMSRYLCSHSYEHMGIFSLLSSNRNLRVDLPHTVQGLSSLITTTDCPFCCFQASYRHERSDNESRKRFSEHAALLQKSLPEKSLPRTPHPA